MNDTTTNSFSQNKSGHGEQLMIGFSYVASSLFFLVPYVACIYAMLTNKKLGSPAYYYIVMQISLADFLQLIFIGLSSGIFMIFPSMSGIHWLNRWSGATGLAAWILYITTANLLAINRLIHTCFHSSTANRIFSKKLTKIYLGVISCYALSWFFTFTMSADTEFVFARDYYSWIYGESSSSYVASLFELYTDSANICCMIIWYLCIYTAIRTQYNRIQNIEQVSKTRKDKRLLLQASVLCLMVMLVVLTFFCLPLLYDGSVIYVTINCVWISSAGMNSIIYLIFNKTIRIQVINLVGFKGMMSETATVVQRRQNVTMTKAAAVFEPTTFVNCRNL